MSNLNAAEIVALSKVVSPKALKDASAELVAGDYEVDFLVQVSGSLTKGEDYSQRIVAKAEPWTLLAVALSHLNGITVQSIVNEALDADPALVKSIKAEVGNAMSAIKAPTVTTCNGKVHTKLACSGLE